MSIDREPGVATLLLAPVRLWVAVAFSLAAIQPVLVPEMIPAIRLEQLASYLSFCAFSAVFISLAALPLLAALALIERGRATDLWLGFGLIMFFGPAGLLAFGLWDAGLAAVYEVAAAIATAVFLLLGVLARRARHHLADV